MSQISAIVQTGLPHRYHGGLRPDHVLHVHENSRPAFLLYKTTFLEEEIKEIAKWTPTLENPEKDLLLMIATFALEECDISDAVRTMADADDLSDIEMYEDLDEEQREKLYEQLDQLDFGNRRVVSTIFYQSMFSEPDNEYPAVKEYRPNPSNQ